MPVRGKTVARILVVALALVMGSSIGQSQPATITVASGPVPREYWGMHIHRAGSLGTWPGAFGAWRLWDARVAWPKLEPSPGQGRFETVERYFGPGRGDGGGILLPRGL